MCVACIVLFCLLIKSVYWLLIFVRTGDDKFLSAAREAAENAVNCGIEINLECGNYPIALQTKRMARKSKHGIVNCTSGGNCILS